MKNAVLRHDAVQRYCEWRKNKLFAERQTLFLIICGIWMKNAVLRHDAVQRYCEWRKNKLFAKSRKLFYCNGFGEIFWLVYIASTKKGGVVGNQLKRKNKKRLAEFGKHVRY